MWLSLVISNKWKNTSEREKSQNCIYQERGVLAERHDGFFFLGSSFYLEHKNIVSRFSCGNLNQRAPTSRLHPHDRGCVAPNAALSPTTICPNSLNTKACGVKLLCVRVWRIILFHILFLKKRWLKFSSCLRFHF